MRIEATDRVQFWRPRHLPGLELVSASYEARSFPVHSHPEYVIGAIVEGMERLSVAGRDLIVRAGSTLYLHPDEPHANSCVGEARMGYLVFYIPADLMPAEMILRFPAPVSHSAMLFGIVSDAHRLLGSCEDRLEQEQLFLTLLDALPGETEERAPVASPPKLDRAKAYLEAHFRDSPGLSELAAVAELSPFHLLRSFRRQFGLSPAAYRNQLRVMEARRLLRRGESIAEVAAEVGFADQSHLTRLFQRIMGTTPGLYAQQ